MSNLESIIIDSLKSSLISKKTLYVLKGFNYWGKQILPKDSYLLNNDSVIYDDKYDISKIGKKFLEGKALYCFYEDIIWLREKSLGGIMEIHDYKMIIVDNNLFDSYYPDFPNKDQINLEKIVNFNTDTDNMIQKYYSDVVEIFDQNFIVYNEIPEADYQVEKITNLILKKSIVLDKSKEIEMPDEFDNASFSEIVLRIIQNDIGSVSVLKEHCSKDYRMRDFLKNLKKIGIQTHVRDFKMPASQIDEEAVIQYREILQRKNKNYNFKDILIYDNPYESIELTPINQSLVIDTIVKNVELSQKGKVFRDIFMTAPTGSGKSVMFQIPAIYLAEKHNLLTIVITPLIGLMNDQVQNIKSMTEKAGTINSDYTPVEREDVLKKVKNGIISILYLSPESLLANTDITSLIGDRRIGLVVVDESHIVATWGKSFRPDYWYLGDYINKLRNNPKNEIRFPIATFTATATFGGDDDMYQDIIDSLKMTPIKFIGNVKRDDISFDIRNRKKVKAYREEKIQIAVNSIKKLRKNNDKILVYTPYVKQIGDIYEKLDCQEKIGKYHGGMISVEKNDTLKTIKNGTKNIVLATKAFGMGIDIDDIKYVYHFAPTGNIADYVQEIGRVARRRDMTGVAITDFYQEDFRYVDQLYGMSSIKNYQVIGALKKILELYNKYNRRNFLVAPEEFSFLYANIPFEEVDAKLKTTLLIIKKDFEINNKTGFSPIVFKPRSMFTFGYFMINDDFINDLKRFGVMHFFEKLNYPRTIEEFDFKGNTCITKIAGDIYKLDFKGLWEEKYKDLSFAQFKHSFFNNNLKGFNYYIKEKIVPRTILEIGTGDTDIGSIRNQLISFLLSLKEVFNDLKQENKYFDIDQLSHKLKQKICFKKSYIADIIAASIIPMISNIETKGLIDMGFVEYRADKYYIKNSTYEAKIYNLIGTAKTLLGRDEDNYIIKYINSSSVEDKNIIVAQLLKILEFADIKILVGNNPEFFIRVNSPYAIEKIVNNKSYQSKTLKLVDEKHKNSCVLMEYFFTELKNNIDRWGFIEKYFLGMIDIKNFKNKNSLCNKIK